MSHSNYLLARATSMVLRTLERDLVGSKIPDMIVDNLIHDLCCFSHETHKLIIEQIKENPVGFANKAYKLWKLGELSIIQLTNDLQAADIVPIAA